LPSADTFYIDRKTLSAAQGKLDERLKDSPLMLTMIEWCRSAAKDGGSPGRIRTSEMTVTRQLDAHQWHVVEALPQEEELLGAA
jgi:hypothetical protein